MLNWKKITRPIVALSPMADMTDSPFCRIAKKFGWPVVFREMVSSDAIARESTKTMRMAAFYHEERPIIQQIFGHDPNIMASAAAQIEKAYAPDGIDINMGCPVYKIVSNFNGASLMKDPARAQKIIRAVKSAVSIPVSVKIRLGWSDKTDCLDFAPLVEDAGADLITIHGRTRAQGYSGSASWEMIGRAKDRVSIPVICNGDIHTPERVDEALRISGCDGVLIARGALGCPWFYRWYQEIQESGKKQSFLSFSERRDVIIEHARLHVEEYGERGIKTFRKHLSWYLKGFEHAKLWRARLMKIERLTELEDWLRGMDSNHDYQGQNLASYH